MSYYPFGLQLCDGTTDSNVQSHRYNGKELDKMHGLNTYDYGARQYNPVTARWDRMDPLAEKYYSISPYAYCAGNPVRYVDPDGRIVFLAPIVYAMCTGAAIGASVEYGSQVVTNLAEGEGWESFTKVDIGDICIEGVCGAATFGSGTVAKGLSKLGAKVGKDVIKNTFDIRVKDGHLQFESNSITEICTNTLVDGVSQIVGEFNFNGTKVFKEQSPNQVSKAKRKEAHKKGESFSATDAKETVNRTKQTNELKKKMNKEIDKIVSEIPGSWLSAVVKGVYGNMKKDE